MICCSLYTHITLYLKQPIYFDENYLGTWNWNNFSDPIKEDSDLNIYILN